MADFSLNILNKPETRYKVASITKAFTSVLILQLVEQGNIDLEKPIITYLPEYKGAERKQSNHKATTQHDIGHA
ncbi:serine hydrolase [Pedobacter panaciterrae]